MAALYLLNSDKQGFDGFFNFAESAAYVGCIERAENNSTGNAEHIAACESESSLRSECCARRWQCEPRTGYDGEMSHECAPFTRCLSHQLPEDQTSPVGLVCSQCKQSLYANPPRGRCLSFWESQPAAYSPEGEPCFVYTLMWDDFRIRSLHAPDSLDDPRGRALREKSIAKPTDDASAAPRWRNRLNDGPSALRPPYSDADFKDNLELGGEGLGAD
jgi:hypothetical protein